MPSRFPFSRIVGLLAVMGASCASNAFANLFFTLTDLGTLGGADSHAYAVNEAGQVVGSSMLANGDVHAFLYENGNMTDLGTLGGQNSVATGINNRGQIIGTSDEAGNQTASVFLYSGGNMTRIGVTVARGPKNSLAAVGINDRGEIVGTKMVASTAGKVASRGFLYAKGKVSLLDPRLTTVVDLDEQGRVLGYGPAKKGFRTYVVEQGRTTTPAVLADVDAIPEAMTAQGDIAGVLRVNKYPFIASKAGFSLAGRSKLQGSFPALTDSGIGAGWFTRFGENLPVLFYGETGRYEPLQPLTFDPINGPQIKIQEVTAASNHLEIVGHGAAPAGGTHACLLTPNTPSLVISGISGPTRRTTKASHLVIRGWCFGPATAVAYSRNFQALQNASGIFRWQFTARLRRGDNQFSVIAMLGSRKAEIRSVHIVREKAK